VKLSIEISQNGGVELEKSEVVIFGDNEGIEHLRDQLNLILQNKQNHFHCMTPSWGGTELSEASFGDRTIKINKLSVGKVLI
jgi:hypothetical protein